MGLASTSSVSYQLSVLQDQGLVVRQPGRPRTAKVLSLSASHGGDAREEGGAPCGEPLAHVPHIAGLPPASRSWPIRYPGTLFPFPGC